MIDNGAGASVFLVGYDKRALQIAGEPALFVSGAIHPPRGTPEMWSGWFAKAKENNLNMVQVYIFWNYHEPLEGEFNFKEREYKAIPLVDQLTTHYAYDGYLLHKASDEAKMQLGTHSRTRPRTRRPPGPRWGPAPSS